MVLGVHDHAHGPLPAARLARVVGDQVAVRSVADAVSRVEPRGASHQRLACVHRHPSPRRKSGARLAAPPRRGDHRRSPVSRASTAGRTGRVGERVSVRPLVDGAAARAARLRERKVDRVDCAVRRIAARAGQRHRVSDCAAARRRVSAPAPAPHEPRSPRRRESPVCRSRSGGCNRGVARARSPQYEKWELERV